MTIVINRLWFIIMRFLPMTNKTKPMPMTLKERLLSMTMTRTIVADQL